MTGEIKEVVIYYLKRLAHSDSQIQPAEQSYILGAANQLGMNQDQIDNIFHQSYQISSLPSAEQDRMTVLYYVLFLASADHVILDSEYEEVERIGFELGFRAEQVRKMLDIVKANKSKDLPPHLLLDVIRASLN